VLCLAFKPGGARKPTRNFVSQNIVGCAGNARLEDSPVSWLEHVKRAALPQLCIAPSESVKQGGRLFGAAELNIIYDSKCGVCQWEVDFLKARDANNVLTYTDLESADFEENAPRNGYLDYETALASFHAVTADGKLLKGMPVFQAAYSAVGLGWVWRIYNNPIAAKLLDFGYSIFARYRTDLTRGSSLEALYSARRAARQATEDCESCVGRTSD
jgi:predicted DCC family thiol-disulfide oxidoreductase YuxK